MKGIKIYAVAALMALAAVSGADIPSDTELKNMLVQWKNSAAGKAAREHGFYKEKAGLTDGKAADASADEINILKQKLQDIENYKAKNPNAKFSINTPFTMMTEKEFIEYLKRSQSVERPKAPSSGLIDATKGQKVAPKDPSGNVDWMGSGCVASVKDQGACGSCWAFGATASIEYEYCNLVNNHKLQLFSEQQMTSCTPPYGCAGGWPDAAMMSANSSGGMCTDTGYPYVSGSNAQTGECRVKDCQVKPMTIAPHYIQFGEDQLTAALDQRPVTVILNGALAAWSQYVGGVMSDCGEPSDYSLYHVVLAVGYGVNAQNINYYKLKNQWGSWWGDQGFIYLQRGSRQAGLCNVASSPLYADVQGKTVVDQCTAIDENTDYVAFDIKSTKQSSADKCCADCQNTGGCMLYVWTDYEGGTCWLKHTAGLKVWKLGARASFLTNPPKRCTGIEENTDYYGNDLASTRQTSVDKCCEDCNNAPGCVMYVWTDYEGGTCWLKSAKGTSAYKSGARASSLTSPLPPRCGNEEQNTDYFGNDIANNAAANSGECCKQCSTTKACNSYSWWNGRCYLKSIRGGVTGKSGVTSARAQKCAPYEYWVDYVGNDIKNVRAALDDCCAHCRNTVGCKAFTWNGDNGGTCYLKSAKGSTVSNSAVSSSYVIA